MTNINKLAAGFKATKDWSAKRLTAKLRRHAYESGWPVELSRTLKITPLDNGNFSVNYPARLESQILGLEFGDQNTPPNPAILRTSNRVDDIYDDHLARISTALGEVKYI